MNDLKQIKSKIRFHPFNQKQKGYCRLLEKYYNIASLGTINTIKREIFNPKKNLEERRETYEKFKDVVLALKPVFKEMVCERNRIFREKGDENYFDFIVKKERIPSEKLALFFEIVDKIIENLNRNLPLPTNLPEWYWSEFNVCNPLLFFHKDRYLIPDDIYKLVINIFPEIKKIVSRIEVGPITDLYPRAKFVKETKSVLIQIPSKTCICNALTFVHELGHALSLIELADRGMDPLSKSRYWYEKDAFKFKFQFEEKCLSKEIKNSSRGAILNHFVITFFEHEIYNNPDQDFDKAYAEAINRCYPDRANQKENPFYVIENGFINRPCSNTTTSVVCTELLSRQSKI